MCCQRYLANVNAHDITNQRAGKPHQLEVHRSASSTAEAAVDLTIRRHTRPYVYTFNDLSQAADFVFCLGHPN